MINFDDLLNGFAQTGAQPGDLLMFHSSYKSFGGVDGGADTVIDALVECVLPDSTKSDAEAGAVFFPTYGVNAWCNQHYWHIGETPSEMGAISEAARLRQESTRTMHPIHNFAIIGGWRQSFNFQNLESYGERSPYNLFNVENGLVISAGVPWDDTFTMVHYAERLANAPWRRYKKFAGTYVDSWGQASLRTYSMHVRRDMQTITSVARLYDEYLVPRGVVKQVRIGGSLVSYFRTAEYVDAVIPLVQSRPELFYYEKRWKE